MKTRQGFVSNSSSSSFICDVCGNVESGMDLGLEEIGMFECKNGHLACESCSPRTKKYLKNLAKGLMMKGGKAEEVDPEGARYEVPAEHCSICQLEVLSTDDALAFLHKETGLDNAGILKLLKERYKNYKELVGDLK